MKCCAKRLRGATVACDVAEVELASTLAALRAILRASISEGDTRCNWHVARNIARNVASCVRTFRHGSNVVFHMRRIECKLAKRIVFDSTHVKCDV